MRQLQLIVDDRQTGKTTTLLRYMAKRYIHDGVRVIFVCMPPQEAMRVLRMARADYGSLLASWQFLSYHEARNNRAVFAHDKTEIVFDNLDQIIGAEIFNRFNVPIVAATWSAGEHSHTELITRARDDLALEGNYHERSSS